MYLKNVIAVIQSNRTFYLSFLIFWILALYYQLTASQFALSIWVNNWHTPFLDNLMIWFTWAGEGLFLVIVGLILIILRKQWWLIIITCLSAPSLVTQVLKRTVFSEYHRPSVLMAHIPDLYYVDGVVMNQFNSFPSGHTTAAFSLYPLLALMFNHKQTGWIWVLIASMVGLSRVYLLQHFWADILVGSLIGTITCTLLFAWLQPKNLSNEINA